MNGKDPESEELRSCLCLNVLAIVAAGTRAVGVDARQMLFLFEAVLMGTLAASPCTGARGLG
jgi:hypothetical protein